MKFLKQIIDKFFGAVSDDDTMYLYFSTFIPRHLSPLKSFLTEFGFESLRNNTFFTEYLQNRSSNYIVVIMGQGSPAALIAGDATTHNNPVPLSKSWWDFNEGQSIGLVCLLCEGGKVYLDNNMHIDIRSCIAFHGRVLIVIEGEAIGRYWKMYIASLIRRIEESNSVSLELWHKLHNQILLNLKDCFSWYWRDGRQSGSYLLLLALESHLEQIAYYQDQQLHHPSFLIESSSENSYT